MSDHAREDLEDLVEEDLLRCPSCGEPDCIGGCPEQQDETDEPWMHDSAYDQ